MRHMATRLKKLGRAFYQRPAIDIAQDLLGKILVHRVGKRMLRARIVETEAYIGEHDLALREGVRDTLRAARRHPAPKR